MNRPVLVFIVAAFAVMAAVAEYVFSGRTVHVASSPARSVAPVTTRGR